MIGAIDHAVPAMRDPVAAEFHARVPGVEPVTFGDGRRALRFGAQKINLRTPGEETRNHACIGSGDLCLITRWTPEEVLSRLKREGMAVAGGPVTKSGAQGPITSIHFNDPDGNLIEIGRYG